MGKAEKSVQNVRFSIIICVYNTSEHLYETVTSVVNQTYEDFELLLVDDDSTDGNKELCCELASEDNRIRVFHQESKGKLAARERGISEATGDYLIFLDAGDCLDINALKTIVGVISGGIKPDILLYNGWMEQNGIRTPVWQEDAAGWIDANIFRERVLEEQRYNQIWLKAFRRELTVGRTVTGKGRDVQSDIDILMQLPWFTAAKAIYSIPNQLYHYDALKESNTQELNKSILSDAIYMHQILYYYALCWKSRMARKWCNTHLLENAISFAKQTRFEKKRLALLHCLAEQQEIRSILIHSNLLNNSSSELKRPHFEKDYHRRLNIVFLRFLCLKFCHFR